MRTKGHQNKLMKIITLPLRFLKKGRDFYVRSMMDVASKPRYGNSSMMGSMNKSSKGAMSSAGLPKSFSTSVTSSWSSNLEGDDLRELIRANSTTFNSNDAGHNKLRADMDLYLKQLIKEQQIKKLEEILENNRYSSKASSNGIVPRSVSVGMGKIDEEKPFEEDEEEEEGSVHVKKKSEVMFPRSKSHAVTQTVF